jgi:hypothetical protein
MARQTGVLIVAAVVVVVGVSRRAAGQETGGPAVTLRVYNYAAVPAGTLQEAREKILRIFQEAGVGIEWIEPLANQSGRSTAAAVSSPPKFAVRMMIRPKMVAKDPTTPASVMGIALASDESGGTVSLFYDQVCRVARRYQQPIADLLAIAIAHEVGHLLLPPPSHSATGIMRASWDGDDIRHAVVGQLSFTAREASLMREKLAGCCAAERTSAAK